MHWFTDCQIIDKPQLIRFLIVQSFKYSYCALFLACIIDYSIKVGCSIYAKVFIMGQSLFDNRKNNGNKTHWYDGLGKISNPYTYIIHLSHNKSIILRLRWLFKALKRNFTYSKGHCEFCWYRKKTLIIYFENLYWNLTRSSAFST